MKHLKGKSCNYHEVQIKFLVILRGFLPIVLGLRDVTGVVAYSTALIITSRKPRPPMLNLKAGDYLPWLRGPHTWGKYILKIEILRNVGNLLFILLCHLMGYKVMIYETKKSL